MLLQVFDRTVTQLCTKFEKSALGGDSCLYNMLHLLIETTPLRSTQDSGSPQPAKKDKVEFVGYTRADWARRFFCLIDYREQKKK